MMALGGGLGWVFLHHGFFETADPEEQAFLKGHEYFGKHIRPLSLRYWQ